MGVEEPSVRQEPHLPRHQSVKVLAWVARASWLALAPLVGGPLSDALTSHSPSVRVVVLTLAWTGWGFGLVATLVPHPIGCTLVRVLAPGALAIAAWAARGSDLAAPWRTAAVLASIGVMFVMLSAEFGEWCVNGPAYPNERRFLLRSNAALLVGPLPISVALVIAGVVSGPIAIAARAWILGSVLTVVGAAVVFVLSRSLHALSRRFVVFVPAGFVLHDLAVLREPVLFVKRSIETMRAAPADTDSLDLTNGAPGLAIEVLLREKVDVTLIDPRTGVATPGATARFLITPTRPGRVLAEAKRRRVA